MTQTEAAAVHAWLVARVTHYLPELEGRIDPAWSLPQCGLDSVYAVSLCGEIEDVWGLAVEPTLLWEVDSIAALTTHITGLLPPPA